MRGGCDVLLFWVQEGTYFNMFLNYVSASTEPGRTGTPAISHIMSRIEVCSALRRAPLPVSLFGSPINSANRLIVSPITLQSTGGMTPEFNCPHCPSTLASSR
jgi:hypothetical protein